MKSISEKAKQLGCDKETVRKKCLKCELPCKKVGNTFIVFEPEEEVKVIKDQFDGVDVYLVKSNINN